MSDENEIKEEQKETPIPEKSARMQAIEQIAEISEKEHEKDNEEYEKNYAEPSGEPEAKVEPEKVEPEAKRYKAKVDGKEVEFDEQKVIEEGIKALQKQSAADRRLEQATLLWKQAQQAAAQHAFEPEKEPSSPEESDARALARALQVGNEEEAIAAINQIRGTGQKQGLTPEEVEMRTRRVFAEESAKAEAKVLMRETFGDLVADPYLMTLAATEEDRLRAMGDQRPQKELWSAIATDLKLYQAYKSKAGQGMEDRQARKQELPEPAGGRKPAPAEEKPQTVDDRIEEMRQRRMKGRQIDARPTMGH